jgi:RNA polymerase subunit RPABC4/transcription elongation factor Spt4
MEESRKPLAYVVSVIFAFIMLFIIILHAEDFKAEDPLIYYFFLFIFISVLITVVTESTFWIIRQAIRYGIIGKIKTEASIGQNIYEDKVEAIKYPNCYNKTTSDHKLCPECGYRLTEDFSVIRCPNCRTKMRTNQKFCYKCGYANEKKGGVIVVCPKCYNQTTPNQKFCPNCGYKLRNI